MFHAVSFWIVGAPTHLIVPHDEHLMVQRDVGVLELQQGHQLYREGTECLSQYWSATHSNQEMRMALGRAWCGYKEAV